LLNKKTLPADVMADGRAESLCAGFLATRGHCPARFFLGEGL
jgi:hypothetical protein